MQHTLRLAALVTAFAAVGACADAPTSASKIPEPSLKKDSKAAERAALLTNVPVTGALSDGGTFVGKFTAQRFDIDPTTRQLSISGVLTGTATLIDGSSTAITQAFTTPVAMDSDKSPGNAISPAANSNCGTAPQAVVRQASFTPVSAAAVCDVLFLDLGPLHLDVLGLTVDLAQVILDVNAVSGAGNLLGNLLCGLLGLLDGIAILAVIQQILDLINNILAGLSSITSASLVDPTVLSAWVGSSAA